MTFSQDIQHFNNCPQIAPDILALYHPPFFFKLEAFMRSNSFHKNGSYLLYPSFIYLIFLILDIYLVSPSPSSTRIEQLMISDPRHIPELPPWTHVPNMGITAEAGSNDVRADHDELAHDDDVDQGHRIKRRRTQSPRAERSVDMEHSTIDINPRNTVGDSQFSRLTPPTAFDNPDTGAIYLPLEDGPPLNISTPFTAKPEDMHGRSAHSPLETRTPLIRNISTFQNQESNPRSLGPRIELLEPSGRVHSNFFAPPESISAATSSSFVPHNSYTAHLRPQIARKFNSSNAAVTRPGGYEATIDEIEKWTHASVTPLVFGKKKYIKNTKSEDVIAMNLRTLKNVGNQSQIAEITAASLNPHGWRDVAIPVVSRSTHRRILLKDIFGVESIVPTYGSTAVRPFLAFILLVTNNFLGLQHWPFEPQK